MGIKAVIDITADERKIIAALLKKYLPNTKIWAYGSRAKWSARPYSDLDLVAFASAEQESNVYELKEAFEESNLPYSVDVFIWDKVPENFRKNIRAKYAVVQDGREKDNIRHEYDTAYGTFSSDFIESRLSDICDPTDGIQTGPFGSQLHKKDYVVNGTPIIIVEHLGENRILHKDIPCVSNKDKLRLSKYSLCKNDIVFSRVGSVDRSSIVRESEDGWLFSGRCLRVRTDSLKIDAGFLSYFFALPSFKEYIRAIAVGATMPSLNTRILSDILISHPKNVKEQRAIAHILGTLDDKIELNRRMNETLEGMARALFKSWFVDFDPVHAKAALRNHNNNNSPLEGESASQGRSPPASRWGATEQGQSPQAVSATDAHNNNSPLEGESASQGRNPPASRWGESQWKEIKRQYTQSNLNLAKILRQNPTDAENILWYCLRKKQLAGHKFRRQQSIGKYIVDFVCMDEKLVVELDGGHHAQQINLDANRERFLLDNGYRVLRYWNNQVISDCYAVLEDIYNYLCLPPHQPSSTPASAAFTQGNNPPTGESAGFALDSPTPPQGGSEGWTVERAKQYLAHMDAETAALFPDRLVNSELGKIPEGWEVKGLDEIADFQNGLALQKLRPKEGEYRLPVIKIAQLRSGQADSGEWASADIDSECVIENGDVIFSWSGSLMVTVWCGGKGALNQHLFRVTSKKYPKWFYLHCTRYHLPDFQRIAAAKAVTMGHIKRHHLAEAKCVVPNKKILSIADKIFSHILAQSISLVIESRSLARQRDTLLPKLISGKIRVNTVS